MSTWINVMRLRCPNDTDPAQRDKHVAYDVRLPLGITALNRVAKSLAKCACEAALVTAARERSTATAKDGRRWHACPNLPERLSRRDAERASLTPEGHSLAAMVRGMRIWAVDEDSVHRDAWPAYVEACKVLRLPALKDGP